MLTLLFFKQLGARYDWLRPRSLKFRAGVAFVGTILWFLMNVLFYALWGVTGIFTATAITLLVAIFLIAGLFKNLDDLAQKRIYDERNIQALMGIYCALSPKIPLPYFRSAALSVDTCLDYIRLIKRTKPEIVIELGSGTLTIVAGYALRLNGKGKVIALDHDKMWAGVTYEMIKEHELEGWAEVLIAPLQRIKIEDRFQEWYDMKIIKDIQRIDILLIDGPPDIYGLGRRYPALPVMASFINENGYIVIDDCVAPKWKKMVIDWAQNNGFIIESRYLNEKDTLFLKKTS